ncbi:hypothetical protein [Endozoicomonas ascidiicola]|uniref:hypothetical protein n=1 Tax=Endozoicomonas ascidiicola TaxID=1698521 RepID=UPI0012FB0433|nr:hypothetical protein [Endozoicomonas ascidiicola]
MFMEWVAECSGMRKQLRMPFTSTPFFEISVILTVLTALRFFERNFFLAFARALASSATFLVSSSMICCLTAITGALLVSFALCT